jgi:hypothetical protein
MGIITQFPTDVLHAREAAENIKDAAIATLSAIRATYGRYTFEVAASAVLTGIAAALVHESGRDRLRAVLKSIAAEHGIQNLGT